MMSALPPKADIAERECHVRFVPIETSMIGYGNRFTDVRRAP